MFVIIRQRALKNTGVYAIIESEYNQGLLVYSYKKMTGKDLRAKVGVTTTVMVKMKNNEPVHLEALIKICKALDCNLDDIVEAKVILTC